MLRTGGQILISQLRKGEDLTDEYRVAETYAKERARQRGKSVVFIYEFHVEVGEDVGNRFYNHDQGHDQWQSTKPLTPSRVTREHL
jgi:hypothetical protein